MKRLLLLATLLGLLAGCAAPASNPIPTAIPLEVLPTIIAQTAESANLAATEIFIAQAALVTPTKTLKPTATFTLAPTLTSTSIPGHKQSAILITSPGQMSKVVSPITLRMTIAVGASKLVQVDLYGEDGRLLTRTLKRNVPTSLRGIPQTIQVAFEIQSASELGRLSVSTQDEHGRIQSLNSVRLLLMSSGENDITTPGNPSEPIKIFNPVPKETPSGGMLNLRMDLWPFNLNSTIVELVDPAGKIIGSRIVAVERLDPQMVETTIPYKISEPTTARLIVRQNDDRISGLFYLYSQEISLEP
ncbi:MAG: hypothetical protein B6D38_12725 [Anaerolineae bacterium UTCFX1]|jgi:hypothetical protein|nr:MAG: hypothetical protein B6D38_12725 [Anaerolineae bacterium UTCFX1]